MTQATIKPTKNYRLHITTTKCLSPKDHLNIKIESQWLGAKNPEGRQTVFNRTLSYSDAIIVATAILWEIDHSSEGVEFL